MKDNASFEGGVQWAWDSTSLTTAMTCPRQYYYSMIRQIQPQLLSVHLRFGGLYAAALEHFYKYRAFGDSIEEALVKVVRETLEETWIDGKPEVFGDPAKSRFGLLRSIVWYIDTFGEESEAGIQTHHLSNGKPAVELSFSFEIAPDIMFCGHLDRVVTYGGQKFVMDQKTTGGTIGSYFFEQFRMSNQMTGYTFAGQVVLDSPVRGVLIDAAQIAVGFTRFERGFTHRTTEQLEEWLENTLELISRTREYTRVDKFPMNLASCDKYGGCPFRPICSTTKSHREEVIKREFREKVWDPILRR